MRASSSIHVQKATSIIPQNFSFYIPLNKFNFLGSKFRDKFFLLLDEKIAKQIVQIDYCRRTANAHFYRF